MFIENGRIEDTADFAMKHWTTSRSPRSTKASSA